MLNLIKRGYHAIAMFFVQCDIYILTCRLAGDQDNYNRAKNERLLRANIQKLLLFQEKLNKLK